MNPSAPNHPLLTLGKPKGIIPKFSPGPGELDFNLNQYQFRQVITSQQVEQFEQLFYQDFHEILGRDVNSREYHTIAKGSRETDALFNNHMLRMIALNPEGEPIGTICCYLDSMGKLPGELKENCDFSSLRAQCTIMELGRLSISKEYRRTPLVSMGLILFIIRNALLYDIDLIIESAFPSNVRMFLNIGFRKFARGISSDHLYQMEKQVCYYNFAAKLYAYMRGTQPVNSEGCLSNYHIRIFNMLPEPEIHRAFGHLEDRNLTKPDGDQSFMLDYASINILTQP